MLQLSADIQRQYMQTRKIIRIVISIILLGFFLGHCANWYRVSFLDTLENIAYDTRLNVTLPNTVDDKVVIVDLDEKSLKELGRWPWPRDLLGKMMDSLFDHYQISIIGYDVIFAEKDESSGIKTLDQLVSNELSENPSFIETVEALRPSLEYDQIFAKSLENRKAVLGFVFNGFDDITYGQLPKEITKLDKTTNSRLAIIEPRGFTSNLPAFQNSAFGSGFFDNPRVSNDGIFRKVPLLQKHNSKLYESLALAVSRAYLNSPNIRIVVGSSNKKTEYTEIEHIALGQEKLIPVDRETSVLVPYLGRQGSFKYISAYDVISKKTAIEELRGKIVLLGTTAPGLLDLRATPVQKNYPGVEVHANIIAGILDDRIKHQPAYDIGYEFILNLIVGAIMIALLSFVSPLVSIFITLGTIALIVGSNMYLWSAENLVLPIASPLALTLCLFVLQMSYGFLVESRNKRALAKQFGQYIPPELVEEMDVNESEISMEGDSREMTVLFSDVRGFTTISENLDPKELTQLMNEFLTPITQVIHKHRGTIDKYMGDAVMAFWGAPLNDPYHAKNALLASLDMLKVLESKQADFKKRGWPEIKIGIGLNSGVMNVGNMGSEFRRAYTVLGDSVNLGSRLEGLTKQYGVSIIVGQETKKAVDEFEYIELDQVRVKGKDQPVKIYEPLGYSIELDPAIRKEVRHFKQALEMYRRQSWDAAEREIFSLSRSKPDRKLYQIYLERIMHYRQNPPGEAWDGVWTHTSK